MYDKNIENILYAIIENVSREDSPIVFCGGLALKDLLFLNNPQMEIDRKTIDIDANWGAEYDQEKIVGIFNRAVKDLNSGYSVELFREPENHKTMGLEIYDENHDFLTKVDINIKENPFYVTCTINDVNIKYSSLEKIMADKLVTITNSHIYRRTKDLLDIYMILLSSDVNMDEVYKILSYDKKTIGDSFDLLNEKEVLKNGYNSLKGIVNKPSFDDVYNKVVGFLKEEHIITISSEIADNHEM